MDSANAAEQAVLIISDEITQSFLKRVLYNKLILQDGLSWLAVGHTDRTGDKPARNVFGRDFQQHGLVRFRKVNLTDVSNYIYTDTQNANEAAIVLSTGLPNGT